MEEEWRYLVRSFKYVVSRKALIECPLLHGNIQKETDTEKSIYYHLMRFGDSRTVNQPPEAVNSLH